MPFAQSHYYSQAFENVVIAVFEDQSSVRKTRVRSRLYSQPFKAAPPDYFPERFPDYVVPDHNPDHNPNRFPDHTPGRFPDHVPNRFPDYLPDRFPDRSPILSCPVPSHQEIVYSHHVPLTKKLPNFPSHSRPAVNERGPFLKPSLGKIPKKRLRWARRSHPIPRVPLEQSDACGVGRGGVVRPSMIMYLSNRTVVIYVRAVVNGYPVCTSIIPGTCVLFYY